MALDTQRRQQMIDGLANRIAKMGMIAPAILFLETYKPLAYLGGQMLWVAQPFLSLGLDSMDLRDFTLLVQDRVGIDALLDRLESIPVGDSASQIQ